MRDDLKIAESKARRQRWERLPVFIQSHYRIIAKRHGANDEASIDGLAAVLWWKAKQAKEK